jgi:hypothetical protein
MFEDTVELLKALGLLVGAMVLLWLTFGALTCLVFLF